MATLVNGARIEQAGYEYGVSVSGGEERVFDSYQEAQSYMTKWWPQGKLKMRCKYVSEWLDAK